MPSFSCVRRIPGSAFALPLSFPIWNLHLGQCWCSMVYYGEHVANSYHLIEESRHQADLVAVIGSYFMRPQWGYWLVVSNALKNMSSSIGMIILNIWENKSHVPNHQPGMIHPHTNHGTSGASPAPSPDWWSSAVSSSVSSSDSPSCSGIPYHVVYDILQYEYIIARYMYMQLYAHTIQIVMIIQI